MGGLPTADGTGRESGNRSSHTGLAGDSGKWEALGETAAAPGAEEVGFAEGTGKGFTNADRC